MMTEGGPYPGPAFAFTRGHPPAWPDAAHCRSQEASVTRPTRLMPMRRSGLRETRTTRVQDDTRPGSVERAHHGPKARIGAGRSGCHRLHRIRVDVRRPQAIERDEVAVLPVHAGDAVILVPAGAIGAGDLLRHGLVLARPQIGRAHV